MERGHLAARRKRPRRADEDASPPRKARKDGGRRGDVKTEADAAGRDDKKVVEKDVKEDVPKTHEDSDDEDSSDSSDFDLNALSQEVRPAADFEGSDVEDNSSAESSAGNNDSDSDSDSDSNFSLGSAALDDSGDVKTKKEDDAVSVSTAPAPPLDKAGMTVREYSRALKRREREAKRKAAATQKEVLESAKELERERKREQKKMAKEQKKLEKKLAKEIEKERRRLVRLNGTSRRERRVKANKTRLQLLGRASITPYRSQRTKKPMGYRVYVKNQEDTAKLVREVKLRTFNDAKAVAEAYTAHKLWGVRKVKGYEQWFQAFHIQKSRIVALNFHSTAEEAAREHDEALLKDSFWSGRKKRLNYPELEAELAGKAGDSGADLFARAYQCGWTNKKGGDRHRTDTKARAPRTEGRFDPTRSSIHQLRRFAPGGFTTTQWRNYTFATHDQGAVSVSFNRQEQLEIFNLERLVTHLFAQDRFSEAARIVRDLNRHVIAMGRLTISRPFCCMVRVTTLTLFSNGKQKLAESYVRKLLPLVQSFHVGAVTQFKATLGETISRQRLPVEADARQEQIWRNWLPAKGGAMHPARLGVWADARAWLITSLARIRAAMGRTDEALMLFDQHLQLMAFRGRAEPRITAAGICVLPTEHEKASLAQLEVLRRAQAYLHHSEISDPLASDLIGSLVETQLQMTLLVGVSASQRLTQQSQDLDWLHNRETDAQSSRATANMRKTDTFFKVFRFAQDYPHLVSGNWGLARLYDLQLQMTDEEDEIFHAKTKADLRAALVATLRCDPLHLEAARRLTDLQEPPLPGETYASSFDELTQRQTAPLAGAGNGPSQDKSNVWAPPCPEREALEAAESLCDSIECLPFEICPNISTLHRFSFGPHYVYDGQESALALWELLGQCTPASLAQAGAARAWWNDRFFQDWQEVRYEMTWCHAVPEHDSVHYKLMRQMLSTGVKMGFVFRESPPRADNDEHDEQSPRGLAPYPREPASPTSTVSSS